MINTGGYQVNVMPQAPVVDPRLLAFDPTRITQGAMQGLEVASTIDQMKAFRAQQAEQEATRQARIDQIKAISELQVLQAAKQHQLQGKEIAAKLAELGYTEADMKGKFEDLPSVRQGESEQRAFDSAKRGFGLSKMKFEDKTMEDTYSTEISAKKAEAAMHRAMAANYLAEMEKNRALAAGAGIPKDKLTEAWENKVGGIAAVVGLTPDKIRELYQSDAKNSDGVLLSAEFGRLANLVEKPEFYQDPYSLMSKELMAWLGKEPVTKIASGEVARALKNVAGDKQTAVDVKPAPAKENKVSSQEGQVRIKVDSSGNIERPAGEKKVESAKVPPQKDKAPDSGISALEVAGPAGAAALTALSSKKLTGSAGKLAMRLWQGKNATGQWTGNSIKGIPSRALANLGRLGAGSAVAPALSAYSANEGIGKMMSDKDTGDLTVFEAAAKAATQPSFDRMSSEAHYDEIQQRINMVLASERLTEPQKMAEIDKLLNARDIMWTVLNTTAGR